MLAFDDRDHQPQERLSCCGRLRVERSQRFLKIALTRRLEKVRPDYIGFAIPDLFVVGYGLDFAERYRNLPFVGVLRPQYYQIG